LAGFALRLLGLAAFNRQHAWFCGDRDFVRRETGQGQRNLVTVFAQTLDIAKRVVFISAILLRGIDEVEKTVKADGRPPQGSKIIGRSHAKSSVEQDGTRRRRTPRRPFSPGPRWAPGPLIAARKKLEKVISVSRADNKI
jgi:hypothetical protein